MSPEPLAPLPPAIMVLPTVVANQIAAGEVVTRPASVAKELVENALDAGATRITVELESGGTRLIRISDNGHGMSAADAELSLQRHATSKIRTAEDLCAIRTLGFRGEALPSIASVSRFSLRTRRAMDETGTEIHVEGGQTVLCGPCGCAPGTAVEVADLFYNVPARRKFLRALSTESAHVTEVVVAAALARPEVSFTLLRDGRVAREWLCSSCRRERVQDVLGQPELCTCDAERGPLAVEAYLGAPDRARPGAAALHVFVNERPVQDRVLARAVAFAYGDALDHGCYPVGAVFLRLPPELVDVNVHPQKAEVRFAHARAVTDALHAVVQSEIVRAFHLPLRSHGLGTQQSPEPAGSGPAAKLHFGPGGADRTRTELAHGSEAAWVWPVADAAAANRSRLDAPGESRIDRRSAAATATSAARFVAQVRRRFLVFDTQAALLVVDQPAAQRWLARTRLSAALAARTAQPQRLLFPIVAATSPALRGLVEQCGPTLEPLGFDLRAVGSLEVALHAVPAGVGTLDAGRFLTDFLDALGRVNGNLGRLSAAEIADLLVRHAPFEPTEPTAADAQALLHELRSHGAEAGTDPDAVMQALPWHTFEPSPGR